MGPRHECEFYLLRYVPDPVRNEFVHVGVILREAGAAEEKKSGRVNVRTAVRFTSDWRRVRCLHPDADTGMLESLESELRRRLNEEPEGNLMHVLEDSFSNSVQVTRAKGYLADSMETGVEELMRLYVEPLRPERVSRISGRAAVQLRMRTEFERAGVWDLLLKRIEAAKYTRSGDPLRIDLGYRALAGIAGAGGAGPALSGQVRMFQAVSLEASVASSAAGSSAGTAGVEMAKGLAFSAAALMEGVERVESARLEMTAVVEPIRQVTASRTAGVGGEREDSGEDWEPDSERAAAYRFAVETMEEHGLRVITTADLGRAAATARRELQV